MATVAPQEEAQDKECVVCNEPFTTPKILPCGHILCQHCLAAWLKTRPEAKCPSCRYPILDKSPSSDEEVANVIDSFPTHLLMVAMVEAECLLSKPQVCCVCEDEAAVSLCLSCSDMFCQMCTRVHKKQSATKHHQVEELSGLTADVLAAKRSTNCTAHANEVAQVHCLTHGVPVCVLCATTDHRQCPHMVKIETRAEQSNAVLEEVRTTLKSGLDTLDRAIADAEEEVQEVDRQTEAGVADVKAVRLRLEKAVRDYCQHLQDRVLSTSADLKGQMLDGKASLQKQRGRFAMHSHIVQQAERLSTHGSFSAMMAMMKTRVSSLDYSNDFLTSVKVNQKLTTTIDLQVVTRIEQELPQMGMVSKGDTAKLAVLVFHENHGSAIKLSSDRLTAERTCPQSRGDGMVISRDPMVANKLYEVSIESINNMWDSTFVGVVTSCPDTFHVPHSSIVGGLKTVLCVTETGCLAFDQLLRPKWPTLHAVPQGSLVGLVLDSSRRLHLYVDGQNQGVITIGIPEPCYFMFDLHTRCTKVTALPVRPAPGL